MNDRTAIHFITDILEAMQHAVTFTDGVSLAEFSADTKTFYAVVRCFEIIGEAANRVPDEIKNKFTDIPWNLMRTMRNKMIHDYFGIDHDIVYTTATEKLIPLIISLEELLDSLEMEQSQ
jgi:uncharacterized protein with HEPN domain